MKARIDDFLTLVNHRERDILSDVNRDLTKNPQDSINSTFDVRLANGNTYRTQIIGFDNDKKQFLLNPGNWDKWPHNCACSSIKDLNTIGMPDSFNTVPKVFALRFNPIQSVDNIGKLYTSRGRLVKVQDLAKLAKDVKRGFVNSCPHNANVARPVCHLVQRIRWNRWKSSSVFFDSKVVPAVLGSSGFRNLNDTLAQTPGKTLA